MEPVLIEKTAKWIKLTQLGGIGICALGTPFFVMGVRYNEYGDNTVGTAFMWAGGVVVALGVAVLFVASALNWWYHG